MTDVSHLLSVIDALRTPRPDLTTLEVDLLYDGVRGLAARIAELESERKPLVWTKKHPDSAGRWFMKANHPGAEPHIVFVEEMSNRLWIQGYGHCGNASLGCYRFSDRPIPPPSEPEKNLVPAGSDVCRCGHRWDQHYDAGGGPGPCLGGGCECGAFDKEEKR